MTRSMLIWLFKALDNLPFTPKGHMLWITLSKAVLGNNNNRPQLTDNLFLHFQNAPTFLRTRDIYRHFKIAVVKG